MAHVRLTDKDRGARAMKLRLREMEKGMVVRVGVIGQAAQEPHSDTGLTNVDVATFHEFGTNRAPQRSFIRATADQEEANVHALQRRIAKGVKDGRLTLRQGGAIIGETVKAKMQERIHAGIPPANAPSTIRRKGSSKPLVDTGQMVQSLSYDVQIGGKGEAA